MASIEAQQGICSAEMPKYRSHKTVSALRIAELRSPGGPQDETDGSLVMVPDDPRYGAVLLDAAYVKKHQPKVGGYYVVYADGYKSWSPAEAFEEGYTRI
jgi:hypothetical protein